MKLLKRNTTPFLYMAYLGKTEVLEDGRHTGDYTPSYGDPIQYRGNISPAVGFASDNYFGVGTQYTHILLLDNPKVDITEDGLVVWNDAEYEVKAVRPSINVMAIGLKKRTVNTVIGGGGD